MKDITGMDKVQFRKFNKKDTSRCSELTVDAWSFVSALVPKEDMVKFMHLYVELNRIYSTWMEVACISDNIVGLFFGRVDSDYKMIAQFKAFFSFCMICIRMVCGRCGRVSAPFTLLRKLISDESNIKRNTPKSDGEVVFIVVDSEYRGRGIGRALMDRFLASAKKGNASVITTQSDEESSWGFYEKYGFQKCSTFHNDLASYIRNGDVKSFIYTIDVQ